MTKGFAHCNQALAVAKRRVGEPGRIPVIKKIDLGHKLNRSEFQKTDLGSAVKTEAPQVADSAGNMDLSTVPLVQSLDHGVVFYRGERCPV